jgi:uncharacterized protein YbaR (Trm112 family)
MKDRRPERFIDILACPRCQARALEPGQGGLLCEACHHRYDVVQGVPILLPEAEEVVVKPLDHISNAVPQEIVSWLDSVDGYSLNLGAGATEFALSRCVELEHAVFRNTDIVGDAHRLPFADEVFEAVLCLNTFEHLHDPQVAAMELRRVLKPGGRILLQTAFLQPLHEEPYHFYGTTEYGLLHWFEGFEIERCSVPSNMSPAMAVGWLTSELLYHVGLNCGPEVSQRLADLPMRAWREMWMHSESRQGELWDAIESLPVETRKRFAAGFQLDAIKPHEAEDEGQQVSTSLVRRIQT